MTVKCVTQEGKRKSVDREREIERLLTVNADQGDREAMLTKRLTQNKIKKDRRGQTVCSARVTKEVKKEKKKKERYKI